MLTPTAQLDDQAYALQRYRRTHYPESPYATARNSVPRGRMVTTTVSPEEIAGARQQIRQQVMGAPDRATQGQRYREMLAFNHSPLAYATGRSIPGMGLWRLAEKIIALLYWAQFIVAGLIVWQSFASDWRGIFALAIPIVIWWVLNLIQVHVNIEICTRLIAYSTAQLTPEAAERLWPGVTK